MKIKKYLAEIKDELLSLIDQNKGLYIIAGCGCGKSYFVKEVLMKRYIVLNVNFLNIANNQNFSESYIEGGSKVSQIDGFCSRSINVKNLQYISEEAANNFDLLVLDEVQELWFSSNYRKESGDLLIEQLKRFKKIFVLTGTPLTGVDLINELGLKVIEIEKESKEEKDKYEFNLVQGLNYNNIGSFTKDLLEKGKAVIIKSDKNRQGIRERLIKENIIFQDIQSSDRGVQGSCTQFLIENETLPLDCNCFICTSILVGAVNIKETIEEREIVYICFVQDIGTPHQLIQLMGRSRNQKKVIYIGFDEAKDFDISFSHIIYQNQESLFETKTNLEKERLISSSFKEANDWKKYLVNQTGGEILYKSSNVNKKDEIKEDKYDWFKFIKLAKENNQLDNYSISFVVKNGKEPKVIESPNRKFVNYIYCDKTQKGRNILKLLDLNFNLESFDDKKLSTLCYIYEVAKIFSYLSSKGSELEKALFSDLKNGLININSESFKTQFSLLLKIKRLKDGESQDLTKVDIKRKIEKPYEVIINFPKTFSGIIRDKDIFLNYLQDGIFKNVFDDEYNCYIESQKERLSKRGFQKQKVKVINENKKYLQGKLGKVYNSVEECRKDLKIGHSTLAKLIKEGFIQKVEI